MATALLEAFVLTELSAGKQQLKRSHVRRFTKLAEQSKQILVSIVLPMNKIRMDSCAEFFQAGAGNVLALIHFGHQGRHSTRHRAALLLSHCQLL